MRAHREVILPASTHDLGISLCEDGHVEMSERKISCISPASQNTKLNNANMIILTLLFQPGVFGLIGGMANPTGKEVEQKYIYFFKSISLSLSLSLSLFFYWEYNSKRK